MLGRMTRIVWDNGICKSRFLIYVMCEVGFSSGNGDIKKVYAVIMFNF
jgi:hypothetical protein